MTAHELLDRADRSGRTDQGDRREPAAAIGPVLAVAGFQLGRLLSRQRLLLAAVGAVFPAAVMLAVRRTAAGGLDRDLAVTMIYALVPEAVCMLGLLVTMCPAVADELERGTWIHVAVRPGGRRALLLGTFLAAVIWTSVVAIVAGILAVAVVGVSRPLPLVAMFAGLVILSTVGRAALFSLPAVILPKRALVASVAVGLVVEYLAGFIPAVVNQATVSLRLRSLLVAWMGWRQRLPVEMQLLVDPQPAWVQVAAIGILAVVLLGAAAKILDYRQFPPSEEI
jgi:ABC-type transport system involved in multi-copper enzyme maturation permease subunit